jgi:hypothetical protein
LFKVVQSCAKLFKALNFVEQSCSKLLISLSKVVLEVRRRDLTDHPNFTGKPQHLRPYKQARMARGMHRLPKVSFRPAMPDPSTPCGQATPPNDMVISEVACPQGGMPAAIFYLLGYPTPYGLLRSTVIQNWLIVGLQVIQINKICFISFHR